MWRKTKSEKHNLEAVWKELSEELVGHLTNTTIKQTKYAHMQFRLYLGSISLDYTLAVSNLEMLDIMSSVSKSFSQTLPWQVSVKNDIKNIFNLERTKSNIAAIWVKIFLTQKTIELKVFFLKSLYSGWYIQVSWKPVFIVDQCIHIVFPILIMFF